MIAKNDELIKAASLIHNHCLMNKCKKCPFLVGNEDDTYNCECRLDATHPACWDINDIVFEEGSANVNT